MNTLIIGRFVAGCLLILALCLPAHARLLLGRNGSSGSTSYQGPCDVITGGGAEAHSVTRAMTSAYSGPLFQLIRLSDGSCLSVGQLSNHTVDTSGIAAFCKGASGIGDYCFYSTIYAQINSNNLIPSTSP